MTTDLTIGNPKKVLLAFTVPMLISVMFQQLYNIADSVIAGKFINENALAAVGASYPITMIFMAIAIGSNVGCSVIVSQLFGAKKYRDMKTAVTTTFLSASALCLLLTVFGFVFCKKMLLLLDTPSNIMKDSVLYLNIYIAGLFFLFMYNICTGIFTALGDSKTPLYFLIFSSVGNILLDLLFVISLHMKIAGVAWATFLAQGISCVLAFIALMKHLKKFGTGEKSPVFSLLMLKQISLVAIPSILQQSFVSVGNLFIQNLVNKCGSSAVAGYSAAVKLNTFCITSFTTLGNALSSFTAQNIGAGKQKRVRDGFRSGFSMLLCIVIPCTLLFFFGGSLILKLFMNDESETAIQTGFTFLKIVSPFYLVISVKLMADGVLRGAGAMFWFMLSTFSDLIIRVALSYILYYRFGSAGIWSSWPVGWTIAMIISVICYFSVVWMKKFKR